MIRVFLADDHPIVRQGLRLLIDQQPDMEVVGEAADGRQVLLAEGRDRWDVLVLDLSLPRVNGIEVLRRLRVERPALKVVILSMYPEEQYARRMVAEGARAFLSKQLGPETLLAALRAVAAGERYVGPGGADFDPDAAAREPPRMPHDSLSAREHQVFTLLLEGRTVTEVAAELDILVSTVSNHVSKVKEKLGARTIGEVVAYAHRAGLIGGA
jgi:DNA-binding NarL/FixJ family response regulator